MVQKNGFQQPGAIIPNTDYMWGAWEEGRIAILPPASSPSHLLLVEANPGQHPLLKGALREEGYLLHVATSLEQALALIKSQAFDLVLAHLPADTSENLFNALAPFKAYLPPDKLGVMSNAPVSADDTDSLEVAFALPTPITMEYVLAEVAICLQKALTPEQKRQAQVVEHFFEALTLRELPKMMSLCTEDIVYYAPKFRSLPGARAIIGKAAVGAYLAALRHSYQTFRLEVQRAYSRPRGLAVKYTLWWAAADRTWDVESSTFLMQFIGDRISQIGLRADVH
jgi:CheY-like chemotaxis protein